MTALDVRTCTEADWPTVLQVDQLAFSYTFDEEEGAAERAILELDRSLLAYASDLPVGHTTAYSLRMSVPGGSVVPFAGVTWVGVVPTHRRQGVLTALMQRQLTEVRERGEVVAALHASEPAIYGRFGFGEATQRVSVTVEHGYTSIDGPSDSSLSSRLTDVASARPAVEKVYTANQSVRAGIPDRSYLWWQRCMFDPKSARGGSSERRCLLVEDASGPRAYAVFSVHPSWENGVSDGELKVSEHAALDPAAAAALWRVLLNIDLVTRFTHENLPVEDPLLHLLQNPRRAQPRLSDAVHVRLVDLPAALVARAYDSAYIGVVEVIDRLAPWNAGRWRLTLGADGAECTRTDAEPDIVLDVRDLGGAFLGASSLVGRALAGQIDERKPGAVAALSRALQHDPAPHCPFVY